LEYKTNHKLDSESSKDSEEKVKAGGRSKWCLMFRSKVSRHAEVRNGNGNTIVSPRQPGSTKEGRNTGESERCQA